MEYPYEEEGGVEQELDPNTAVFPNIPEEGQEGEEEAWLDGQGHTLIIGLVCGLLFQVAVRYYSSVSTGGDNAPLRARSEDPAAVMGGTTSAMRGLSSFSTNNKMVLVVRTDLGMSKGKAAAQCAHAAIMCYKRAVAETPQLLKQWEVFGQSKVTLKAENEEVLNELKARADEIGLVACVVHDAGRTQIEAGSATVLGIGPAPAEVVDKVTGPLKLY